MKTLNFRTPLLALSLFTVAACDAQEPEFGAGPVEDRCTSCGGLKLNTNQIGAHIFSEIDTAGEKHDGVALEYVELYRYGKLEKVAVENGQLVGKIGNNTYDGRQFERSIWHLQVEMQPGQWTSATMTITSAAQDPNGLYGWKYTFVHQYINGPKEWYPNCDKDENAANGEEFDAIVTGDLTVGDHAQLGYRPNTIFIGCLSGGVGKAGYWGYPRHVVGSDERFTGAVRMVRADYCGTGDSFTKVGQAVSVTDIWHINTLVQGLPREALWDENGAACVLRPRLSADGVTLASVSDTCDELGGRTVKECDPNLNLGTPGLLYESAAP